MLKPDAEIHIQDPTQTEQRVLYRGNVAAVNGPVVTAIFSGISFELMIDQTAIITFHEARKFLQQSVNIRAVLESEPQLVIEFEMLGEPASAEGREFYRASTVSSYISADINDESDCTLVDVSAQGFAVIARNVYTPGAVVATTLRYWGEEHTGRMCVQNVRRLGRGRIRYGLRYLDDEDSSAGLKQGLQNVSLAVERESLRRNSGGS